MSGSGPRKNDLGRHLYLPAVLVFGERSALGLISLLVVGGLTG